MDTRKLSPEDRAYAAVKAGLAPRQNDPPEGVRSEEIGDRIVFHVAAHIRTIERQVQELQKELASAVQSAKDALEREMRLRQSILDHLPSKTTQ